MPKKLKDRNFKIIIVGGIIIGLAVVAALYFFMFYQISPAQAQKICQEFSKDVKAQIIQVNGYRVINERKSCDGVKDEMGGTDYKLSVEFKVSKDGVNSVTAIKSNINYLAAKLPRKNYSVWVDNIPAEDAQQQTICVTAMRYLDQNGMNITQGQPNVYPRYTEPGSIEGFSPCENL